ncbi:Lactate utilization protein A [Alphaproteobacteria bacterium SO-S41]|nr:Lactate utilization protein A [Alphaproteobacteria bacterium SO-S41]
MTDTKEAALFVTCLIDLMRPEVGMASARLIERAGFTVVVPRQGCCGQPNYNAGDRKGAQVLARAAIAALEPYETIVVPSGSCGGMMVRHYPTLFDAADPWASRAKAVASRVLELTQFLARHPPSAGAPGLAGKIAYHDSCSSLRDLGVHDEPRALLRSMTKAEDVPFAENETCCGFGGLFCVKYPDVADRIAADKCAAIIASGADSVVSADLGCLLNIGGRLARMGSPIKAVHIAEALAGDA